jgi:hypothetical protein
MHELCNHIEHDSFLASNHATLYPARDHALHSTSKNAIPTTSNHAELSRSDHALFTMQVLTDHLSLDTSSKVSYPDASSSISNDTRLGSNPVESKPTTGHVSH